MEKFPIFLPDDRYTGGTEYMVYNFYKNVLPYIPKINDYLCIVVPGKALSQSVIKAYPGQVIYWLHVSVDQLPEDIQGLFNDPEHQEKIKYIIVPSEHAKQQSLKFCNIDPDKFYPIHNAIYPMNYNPDKFKDTEVIKMVHTPSEDRGMHWLIKALDFVDHKVHLDIFNSFNPDKYMNVPVQDNVYYYNFTPRRTVYKFMDSAHIFPNPSTFYETFCISQVEAMSAGLLPVYNDLGALKDISNSYGVYMKKPLDRKLIVEDLPAFRVQEEEFVREYARILNGSIEMIKNGKWDPSEQIEYVNKKYSWEAVKQEWLEFHDKI